MGELRGSACASGRAGGRAGASASVGGSANGRAGGSVGAGAGASASAGAGARTTGQTTEIALAAGLPEPPVDTLRARLADRAAAAGLLDIAYRTLDTAVGSLLIAATPVGLVSVTFDGDRPDSTLDRLVAAFSPRVLSAPGRLDQAARRLEALIDGRAQRYEGQLDLALARGFGRAVIERLREIPWGETRSYRQVAVAAGSPNAVRAVGTACRRNPLPIAIPCHRVVRSDGSIGEYAGGAAAKQHLLAVEASFAER